MNDVLKKHKYEMVFKKIEEDHFILCLPVEPFEIDYEVYRGNDSYIVRQRKGEKPQIIKLPEYAIIAYFVADVRKECSRIGFNYSYVDIEKREDEELFDPPKSKENIQKMGAFLTILDGAYRDGFEHYISLAKKHDCLNMFLFIKSMQ